MTNSFPEESNPTVRNETAKSVARKKTVVSHSSATETTRAHPKPVVIRKASGSGQKSLRVSRTVSRKSAKVISKPGHCKEAKKPMIRHGQPDFSSSIFTETSISQSRKKSTPSIQQRLFFDTAIAVVSISFMVLTLLRL